MESEFIYHVTSSKEWEEAQIKQSYLPKEIIRFFHLFSQTFSFEQGSYP